MALKNPTITKEQAKEELIRIVNLLGKTPTRNEFYKNVELIGCHKTAMAMLFGTNPYTGLLIFSGLEIQHKPKEQTEKVECLNCKKVFLKLASAVRRSPNHFCSRSCAAIHNNTHKTTGTRRSKLEAYLEEQLTVLFPELEILFNDKTAINSELDIYIPSLKLAFELNGIFHYEPIFGKDKLNQIQNNDGNKFQKCQENQISLCIIDTSSQKRFTELSSKKYLDIIVSIIEQ